MRQIVSKDLFAYWEQLKGARSAPNRADIDPGAIPHILADTFIVEVDADGHFPLRLSGARVNALWLQEQKGRSFLDLWRQEDRRCAAAALLSVIEGVTPVVAGARAVVSDNTPLELELLLLPLRHFGKTHSRVLGALSATRQPEWFGQLRAGPLELVSMRVLGARQPPLSLSNSRQFRSVDATRPRPRLVVYEGSKPR